MMSLRDLTVSLASNGLGEDDAKALATLKDAPSLRTLTLQLGDNALGGSGVAALAALRGTTSVEALTLDLEGNDLDEGDSVPLTALCEVPSLRALMLDLSFNNLGAEDADTIAGFRDWHGDTLEILAAGNLSHLGRRFMDARKLVKQESAIRRVAICYE